jgi:hypothetical protein
MWFHDRNIIDIRPWLMAKMTVNSLYITCEVNLSTEGHTERARSLELTKESELWQMLRNSDSI